MKAGFLVKNNNKLNKVILWIVRKRKQIERVSLRKLRLFIITILIYYSNLNEFIKKGFEYMLPIQRKISPYNHSGINNIKYIVNHYTGNRGDTAKNNADYFNGGDRQASAHYFVDDNSIYQVVEDYTGAWHVGDGAGEYGITNHNSIGIEMCCGPNGEISDNTERNCLELNKYLMEKYNIDIDHVVRHYDASRKICPNWSANNWARWNNFKSKLSDSIKPKFEDEEYDSKMIVDVMNYVEDNYYKENNKDVVEVMGSTHEALVTHYREYGKKEGRFPNAYAAIAKEFNSTQYLINNPDVAEAVDRNETTPITHFIFFGWYEGRSYKKPLDSGEENQVVKENKPKEKFFRVITGSYRNKENAEEQMSKLNKAGFESFIDIYNK